MFELVVGITLAWFALYVALWAHWVIGHLRRRGFNPTAW
jgi:hypothetical protein